MLTRQIRGLGVLLAVLAMLQPLQAGERRVPEQYATLAAAYYAAAPGDVIVLPAGSHAGVYVQKANLTFRGVGPETVIDSSINASECMRTASGIGTTVLQDLTIDGLNTKQYGVRCYGSLRMVRCVVRNCT